eukprot:CAMPEP_0202382550 /NCGR_PEP_ID=MMETSP1127-20130417/43771_1 /ASSEMBLY_ACC=CAM_ASM_000462 /TAXON_ID=3047 /ORGANISM="Dunaliella tertiolecta, Strain CCMP1320" /LENGTH=877 /DNA_ID=CAMNT_0048981771 /DNA_START=237 /DNA_END=2871 /DNA_ORIENTATION=-
MERRKRVAQTYLPGYRARQGAEGSIEEKFNAEDAEGSNSKDECGSDPVLENLIRDVKSKHVRKHFFSNPPEAYTETKDVRILTGSYNVAGHGPELDLDLKPWIGMWDGQWPTVQCPPEPPSDSPSDAQAADAPQITQGGRTEEGEGCTARPPPAVLHSSRGSQSMPPELEASPSMGVQLRHELWAARAASPDIVALGFQEVVPLSAGNVVVGSDTSNVDAWDSLIFRHLNGEERIPRPHETKHSDESHQSSTLGLSEQREGTAQAQGGGQASTAGTPDIFVQVAGKQLVGLYLTIWVRAELLPHIKGVQATQVATGFGGYLGNKGAVLVRMMVYDTPLLFVCSHLSAGAQDGDELWRNYHVREIMGRADFPPRAGPGMSKPELNGGPSNLGSIWGNARAVTDHENIIWLGDLNYRLQNSVISDEEVREHLAAGRLQPLLEADQLHREMEAGRVFNSEEGVWREGPITFYPTYKYHLGGHTYIGDPHIPAKQESASESSRLEEKEAEEEEAEAAGKKEIAWQGTDGTPGPLMEPEAIQGSPTELLNAVKGASNKIEAAAAVAMSGAEKAAAAAAAAAKAAAANIRARTEAEDDSVLEDGREPADGVAQEGGKASPAAKGSTEKRKREKRRTPAWCDRILWLSKQRKLHQLSYNRAELCASDHRPVAAAFLLQSKHFNRQKLEGLLSAAFRSLDSLQASMRPRCTLRPRAHICLGEPLALRESRTFLVELCNEGGVDGAFHFVSGTLRLGQDPLPAWLKISPSVGTVAPGSSCQLKVTACVDTDALPALLAGHQAGCTPGELPLPEMSATELAESSSLQRGGQESLNPVVWSDHGDDQEDGSKHDRLVPLDCITILRVVDGSDHFLSITGSFCRPLQVS